MVDDTLYNNIEDALTPEETKDKNTPQEEEDEVDMDSFDDQDSF